MIIAMMVNECTSWKLPTSYTKSPNNLLFHDIKKTSNVGRKLISGVIAICLVSLPISPSFATEEQFVNALSVVLETKAVRVIHTK